MILIRSLAFNAVYYLTSTVMIVAALPLFLFSPKRAGRQVVRAWARVGIYLLRKIVGARLVVRGLDNIPEGGGVIAAKHQSMFETFALYTILDRPTFVMKRELTRIPLWGWYARRVGMIMVSRDEGTRAIRALAVDVENAVKRGEQVVIFPEGTRRPPGSQTKYRGGVAHLYRKSSVSIVPLALNSGLFWPRGSFCRYPGTIVIAFLPAIAPGLRSQDLMDKLETEIEAASTRLLTEAANDPTPPALLPEALARLKQRQGG